MGIHMGIQLLTILLNLGFRLLNNTHMQKITIILGILIVKLNVKLVHNNLVIKIQITVSKLRNRKLILQNWLAIERQKT